MRQVTMFFSALALWVLTGCSDTDGLGGTSLLCSYNSVYAVNALSSDENITLYVGDEAPETVTPYAKEAVVVEKATGIDNIVNYRVSGVAAYGDILLEKNRTYFYAATDCNILTGAALDHKVESDTQITVVNTSDNALSSEDLNISIDGTQVNNEEIAACAVSPLAEQSVKDQNITVSFSGGEVVTRILPEAASVDIVIYRTPPQEAAIIMLPRLTPDAL